LDEIAEMVPRPSLTLSFEGESTLHPSFSDLLAMAGARGFRPWISTSLKGASQKTFEAMLAHCGTICVSLELERETFAKHRGSREDNDAVLFALDQLLAARQSNSAKIAVSAVLHDALTLDAPPARAFVARWIDQVDEVFLWNEWSYGESIRISAGAGLVKHLRRRRPCHQPGSFLAILSDGTVSPCCVTSRVRIKGVTVHGGIRAALEAPAYRSFLARHAVMDLDDLPCRTCEGWLEGWLGDDERTLDLDNRPVSVSLEGFTARIPGRQ